MVPDVEVEEICSVCDDVETVPEQPDPVHVVTASATLTPSETEADPPAMDVIVTAAV
jgi:hypothetical protein